MTILDDLHLPPGIKIAHNVSAEPAPEDLAMLQGMGVQYVNTWTKPPKATPEFYASRRQFFADNGFTLYGLGNANVHNQDAIVLGLPGREAKIEEYKQHLRNLAAAGIPYTT